MYTDVLTGKVIEEGTIALSGASTGSHTFTASFSAVPKVVLSVNVPVPSGPDPNYAVIATLSSVSKTSFSIVTSASITGDIQFKAIGR